MDELDPTTWGTYLLFVSLFTLTNPVLPPILIVILNAKDLINGT